MTRERIEDFREIVLPFLSRTLLKINYETMRKYQKIVNIVSLNDEEFKQCSLKELKEILEVIADRSEEV